MAKVLGPDEIGLKILPGMIPMLVSGTFSKQQFKELMQSVRRLLDQIENHRANDLKEESAMIRESDPTKMLDFDSLEIGPG